MCMAESLCYSPESVTTLLIDYTPTQNTKLKEKKKRRSRWNEGGWDFKGDKGAEVKIVKCQAKSYLHKSNQNVSEPKETEVMLTEDKYIFKLVVIRMYTQALYWLPTTLK